MAILVLLLVMENQSEKNSLKFVKSLGGEIEYKKNEVGERVVFVNLSRTSIEDSDVDKLKGIRRIIGLDFSFTSISDKALSQIRVYKNLEV